jgi:NADH-quinone oxidoreductase subunit L
MSVLLTSLLKYLVILPNVWFVVSLLISRKMENVISRLAIFAVGSHLIVSLVFLLLWMFNSFPTIETQELTLYDSQEYKFFISFHFDKITAVYLFVGSFLTFLVTIYSSYYMHRDDGYKRFFNTILFFHIGYNIIIFAGSLETLFIGWEILGITSFLLIGFYRDRYLPVKNALKVFTAFRVADVALILAMWLRHELWHESITFAKLADNSQAVIEHLQDHTVLGFSISLMIVTAAAVKSAQLPFSSWMPRAMEGPTPSSAIFYGSLSVHLGVFLLLRTFPFWGHQLFFVILILLLGVCTSIVAAGISLVQSSIKAQIAYSSVAQIGIMFIEVALGFHDLALIHFAGNAFLRTYQLLVSPSVVSYLIREQFYNFIPRQHIDRHPTLKIIEHSFYVLCLKEFNLDSFIYVVLWNPLKDVGRKVFFPSGKMGFFLIFVTPFIGAILLYYKEAMAEGVTEYLSIIFALNGLLMLIKSFTERKDIQLSWSLIIMNHLWLAGAISFVENVTIREVIIYMSGVIISGIAGYLCLLRLRTHEHTIGWQGFQGHVYEHPMLAFVFLLSCIGMMKFPITPSFLGLDLMFTHIHNNQVGFALILALIYIVVGLSVVRMYSRVFLGPHIKSYHDVPGRNA